MMAPLLRRMGLLCLCLALFTGCWDYRGLNEQTIAAGMAVDLGAHDRGLQLTFEIMDLEGDDGGAFTSLLLTTTGDTLGEALNDAHAKLHSKVYLGAADVVIISQQMAQREGILPLLDYLVRNPMVQNSAQIVIAAETRAGDLLTPSEEEEGAGRILSTALGESLRGRKQGTGRSADVPLCYEIFSILLEGRKTLALPLVSGSDTEDIPFQLEGLALFSGDKMTGKLEKEDLPLYLLATAGLQDRAFAIEARGPDGSPQNLVLTVRRSNPRLTLLEGDGPPRFHLNISMTAEVVQLPLHWGPIDEAAFRRMEAGASQTLETQLTALLARHRKEGHDILGLGDATDTTAADLEIQIQVNIQNAGTLIRTPGGI